MSNTDTADGRREFEELHERVCELLIAREYEEAIGLTTTAMAHHITEFGSLNEFTVLVTVELAMVEAVRGNHAKAKQLCRRASLIDVIPEWPDDRADILHGYALLRVARALCALGKYDEGGEDFCALALHSFGSVEWEDEIEFADKLGQVAEVYASGGARDDAAKLLWRAYDICLEAAERVDQRSVTDLLNCMSVSMKVMCPLLDALRSS